MFQVVAWNLLNCDRKDEGPSLTACTTGIDSLPFGVHLFVYFSKNLPKTVSPLWCTLTITVSQKFNATHLVLFADTDVTRPRPDLVFARCGCSMDGGRRRV